MSGRQEAGARILTRIVIILLFRVSCYAQCPYQDWLAGTSKLEDNPLRSQAARLTLIASTRHLGTVEEVALEGVGRDPIATVGIGTVEPHYQLLYVYASRLTKGTHFLATQLSVKAFPIVCTELNCTFLPLPLGLAGDGLYPGELTVGVKPMF